MFGGGPYSVAGSASLRIVGKKRWPVCEISIDQSKPLKRTGDGKVQRMVVAPFMPKSFRDKYHPGGNSLCYMIQTAHLMGCDPIYCLGFTLETGTGYFFGLENPATKRRSYYADPGRAMDWLRWYSSTWPGRVKLWPGWSGPVYDALEVLDETEASRFGQRSPESIGLESTEAARALPARNESVAHRGDDAEGERLRSGAGRAQPVHADGKQPGEAAPLRRAPQRSQGGGQPLGGVQRKHPQRR